VFEELADHLCVAAGISDRKEVIRAIREREAKMSTGIRKGIAIPHGKTAAVDRVYGAIGISRKGIDYDALDGNPVYILFMFLTPSEDTEDHLRLLQRLAELLDNPQFYAELTEQRDAQEAYRILKKHEEILLAR
ncbi:MAG: PTS sugar transporter subunit IIA, partial [Spirochaetaceae bacterium]|nr:PTS sugar transporter subunit IIA [Spirochaetaceae bacterium]